MRGLGPGSIAVFALGPVWRARLGRPALRRLGGGLAVGAVGGALAAWAGVPLAWMMGALFACMAVSLAGGDIDVPPWFRTGFMWLIGLFLGESFSAASGDELARWPASLALAVLYVPVGGFACYLMFRRLARWDKGAALLAGLPGGVTAVAVFAMEMGGDERRVALAQALRVAVVVLAAPAIAFWWLALPAPTHETYASGPAMSLAEVALLVPAALAATWAAARARAPIPWFLGPILASAALRMAGLVEGTLPAWLVEVALLVSGASLGARYRNTPWRLFADVAFWASAATLGLMALSLAFAAVAVPMLGVDWFAALLAYAPGGVAEMSLIAIAIDADPAFVAAHHMARIFAVLLALPLLAPWLRRVLAEDRAAAPPAPGAPPPAPPKPPASGGGA